MKPYHVVAMLSVTTVVAMTTAMLLKKVDKKESDEQQVGKLRDYCNAVHFSLEEDEKDFLSGDPVRQQQALERFGNAAQHSEREIKLCSWNEPILDRWTKCYVDKNYGCLGELAHHAVVLTTQH